MTAWARVLHWLAMILGVDSGPSVSLQQSRARMFEAVEELSKELRRDG